MLNKSVWLVPAVVASLSLAPSAFAAQPKLEVMAEWNRLAYDLGDAAAERAYDEGQLYKKVMLHGVKVDASGQMYVSTARWGGKEVPATLSRLVKKNGEWKLQPFPSKEFNDMNNPQGLKSVLGFEIDRNDVMWILDQGHVGGPSAPGDEKLIGWDIKANKEVARYVFNDQDTDKKCSFLNDVAVDNDSGFIYIADSGINCDPLKGGLLTYNIKTNQAKRILSAPEWVNDEAFTFKINGRDVNKARDGKANPMRTGADGIALSGDKKTLYWTNLTGNRLLSLPTAVARDFSKSEDEVKAAAKVVTTLPSNTDGMTSDRDNNLYMTGLMLNGIQKRDAKTGKVSTYVSSDEISWPDTVGWGPKGTLYFTSNHLQLWVDGDMDFDSPAVPNFRIYRVKVGAKPYTAK